MRASFHLAAALALAVTSATAVAPLSPARAAELASPMIPPKPSSQPMPDEVTAAWGCVAMGSAGTAAAMASSSENLLNVVAGGVVSPANPAVLYLGLAGVVFTSFCTLGQQLTPLYLYYFREAPAPETDVAKTHSRPIASAARSMPLDDEDVMYAWQTAR